MTCCGNRDFRLLFAGQTLSMFGDMAMLLVLAMWAKELTGSNGVAGAVFAGWSLPSLLAPLGGVADRPVPAPHRDDRHRPRHRGRRAAAAVRRRPGATCG